MDLTNKKDINTPLFSKSIMDSARSLVKNLDHKQLTISLAESCTGGLIAAAIVSVPGSSSVFTESFVTYSNQAKHTMLGVGNDLLKKHGAVSKECAKAMVLGCLKQTNTDIAISVTGIAGPHSDNSKKPVGLVFIALATRDNSILIEEFKFDDALGRNHIRQLACLEAFKLALNNLDTFKEH